MSRFKCLFYQKIIIKSIIVGNATAGRTEPDINGNKCIPIILLNFTGLNSFIALINILTVRRI